MAQVFGYPFDRLPRMSARDAAIASAAARWIDARPRDGARVAALIGGAITARVIGRSEDLGRDAARAVVQLAGAQLEVAIGNGSARRIAQHLLGGPAELDAARPLDATERALWAVVVAAALEDLGVAGEVAPIIEDEPHAHDGDVLELALSAPRGWSASVRVRVPRDLLLRVPPARAPAAWVDATAIGVAIALGRCALPRAAIGRWPSAT